MNKQVLIIGSGGREHALARKFAQSPQVEKVYVAPGNAGMTLDELPIELVDLAISDIQGQCEFAKENAIDLTFVGSEEPLSLGVVDLFRQADLTIVGPTKEATQLESSKHYAKEVMGQAGVPTASYRQFTPNELDEALGYIDNHPLPVVLKQDGLAAGKGVTIAQTVEEARETLREMMLDFDATVVIEEFLVGDEFSFFAFVNGESIIPLMTARDYKRAYDNDEGANTGGMGAYSPVDWVTDDMYDAVLEQVVRPVAKQMVDNGAPFTGVLYAGIMYTKDGPTVIEFNTRFGDPETQIMLPLIESDFYDLVMAHVNGEEFDLKISDQKSLGVVVAADNYPSTPVTGMKISLSADVPLENLYFAGVKLDELGQLEASGGRLWMVTAQGDSYEACRQQIYGWLENWPFENKFYRRDIGTFAMERSIQDNE